MARHSPKGRRYIVLLKRLPVVLPITDELLIDDSRLVTCVCSLYIGETGVAWDWGWVGQLNFKYVPDIKIKKYFYLTK